MKEFVDNLNSKYDPIFISTDISTDSKNVLELSKILQGVIDPFKEENKKKSDEILENMLLSNMTKEKIQSLKLKYENDDGFKYDKFKNLEKFLENLYFNEKFLEDMKKENSEKKKVIILIFGNESRGISSVVKKLSHHKIMIPHFGMANTSYNISVACSMILFHMYSTGFLPGTFMDFNAEEGVDILKRKIVNSFPGINREKIKLFGIDEYLDDF
jgi:tRNA(Leu) C34 or U34 (ribose-2'-O)-methylase TrmL